MSDEVATVLNRLPKHSDFVFADKDGKSLDPNWLRDQLIHIAKEAQIEDLTEVHALRHTFASQLLMRGVDLPSVQKLMGHQDIEMTGRYARLTDTTRKEEYFRAMAKIEKGEIDGDYR
jgi:site-specific recombinase XerD